MREPSPDPCAIVREAVSADLDGELTPLRRDELTHHLDVCASCASFADDLIRLARHSRVGAADAVPDLTDAIRARVEVASATAVASEPEDPDPGAASGSHLAPRSRVREVRWLVALAGAAQLVLAVPMLLGITVPDLHLGREVGALQVAMGVGLIFAAAQPRRAPGLLPVVAVVAGATVIAATIDVVAGVATLAAELTHIAELVGVVALWILSRRGSGDETATSVPRVPVGAA